MDKTSEAVGVRLLNYLLEGYNQQVYKSLSSPGVRNTDARREFAWPRVIHAPLRRYLTDDVLKTASEEVTLGTQKLVEDESQFADRLSKAACDCSQCSNNESWCSTSFGDSYPSPVQSSRRQ